ncbi:S-methyl-5'-thioadenosine phosphorylase [Marivita sp. S0852]|uniref:S-methyl-5'-thioadenosine phosphorylase n=1 Tax=Marivita sp. S0852 TaxID=3373893 RepID=UPI003982CEAA
MAQRKLGVIGGSGLYAIEGLTEAAWHRVDTPWGAPSDALFCGVLNGLDLVFLPRHGRGHVFSPTDIPYRANIDALKRLGVTDVISVSACGSFHEAMAPGDFVIVDQFIDRTVARAKSFFGAGCVAHVSMAHPVCSTLGQACATAARDAGVTVHDGGTYLAMEGPQFSTLAESRMYRDQWGCAVIGMTNMPEAKLAREAELCYASVAMVTDYDCWHPEHDAVEVTDIVRVLTGNAEKARAMITRLPDLLGTERSGCTQGCDTALEHAVITTPEARDPDMMKKLDAIAGRVLSGART